MRMNGVRDYFDPNIQQILDEFQAASYFVQNYDGHHQILPSKDSSGYYEFYALYKQATEGPYSPTSLDDEMRTENDALMRNAWKKLGTMSKRDAMIQYMKELDTLVDGWRHWRGLNKIRKNSNKSVTITTGEPMPPEKPDDLHSRAGSSPKYSVDPQWTKDISSMKFRISRDSKRLMQIEKQLSDFVVSEQKCSSQMEKELADVRRIRDEMMTLSQNLKLQIHQQVKAFHVIEARCNDMMEKFEISKKIASESRVIPFLRFPTIALSFVLYILKFAAPVAILLYLRKRFIKKYHL